MNEKEVRVKTASAVRLLRNIARVSLGDAARRVGKTGAWLSNIEKGRGRISANDLFILIAALGKTWQDWGLVWEMTEVEDDSSSTEND